MYMNRDEVVKTLLTRARIDPGFTTLGRILKLLVSILLSEYNVGLLIVMSFNEINVGFYFFSLNFIKR